MPGQQRSGAARTTQLREFLKMTPREQRRRAGVVAIPGRNNRLPAFDRNIGQAGDGFRGQIGLVAKDQ